jgi:hypothetical protein
MELIPLCQPLETARHISLCSAPCQALATSHLLQTRDIQVLVLEYHNLIRCTSITFLTKFITHQLLASISLLVLSMEVRIHFVDIFVALYNMYGI